LYLDYKKAVNLCYAFLADTINGGIMVINKKKTITYVDFFFFLLFKVDAFTTSKNLEWLENFVQDLILKTTGFTY